jgi:hypothetical protein
LWTRLLVLSLGAEYAAVLGAVGGFFLGLALGTAIFHKRIVSSKNPSTYYIWFEIIAALYAVASPFLLVPEIINAQTYFSAINNKVYKHEKATIHCADDFLKLLCG